MDRPTGTVICRYERERPVELIHVDVKKPGRTPNGGGHKVHGREAGWPIRSMASTTSTPRSTITPASPYTEIHANEKVATCTAFLTRTAAIFADLSITRIERVLTDNARAYRKGLTWKQALTDIGATGKLTPPLPVPDQPQSERINRTLTDERAYLLCPTPPTTIDQQPWRTSSTPATTTDTTPHSETNPRSPEANP
ncbi:hypothetical protein [Streptomyces sp. ME01-18a]|uniref:hypothetical protein n=1 Tax=Streptomyces sp. ME01-18a TaxID=3028669 RepID=UPI0039F73F9D